MNSFPLNFKMAAQVWILNEIVELCAVEEEDLFISEDGDQALTLAAVSTYMRRDLNRSEGFSENIVPRYSIDEFTSHFRTGATLEALCREVQATGRVPQCHSYRRPPIPLEKQVLAFVWFIAKSEVVRSVQCRSKGNITGGAHERRRREPLGGSGGMLPQKNLKARGLEMLFPAFSKSDM